MRKDLFDLTGKNVLVTGAGSGMGKAIAEVMAICGAQVLVAEVDETTGQKTVSELVGNGYTARYFSCDIGSKASIDELFIQLSELEISVDV